MTGWSGVRARSTVPIARPMAASAASTLPSWPRCCRQLASPRMSPSWREACAHARHSSCCCLMLSLQPTGNPPHGL